MKPCLHSSILHSTLVDSSKVTREMIKEKELFPYFRTIHQHVYSLLISKSDTVLIFSFILYQMHQFLSQQKCIIHRATTVFDWSLVSFTGNHVWSIRAAIQLQTCHRRMDRWRHSFRHVTIQHYLVLRSTLFLKQRFDATL